MAEIRNGSGNITTNFTEIKRIIRKYYELLYTNKFNDLHEMDKLLESTHIAKIHFRNDRKFQQTSK